MHSRKYVIWILCFGLILLIGISLNVRAATSLAALPAEEHPMIQTVPGVNITCVNNTGTGCDPACIGCYTSIQAAVDAVPVGGSVRIALGTYNGTGDAVVNIDKPLTLSGSYNDACSTPYTGETVLSGENARTVVKVVSAGGFVIFNNLVLTEGIGDGNCDADSVLRLGGCGGGLYVYETHVTVNSCTFTNNSGNTTSGGPWGGAGGGGGAFVANYQSGVFAGFNDCTFTSNNASTSSVGWGGGLWIDAGSPAIPAVINRGKFTNNIASTKNQGHGGGANISGYIDVDDSEFYQNRGGANFAQFGYGGALYVWQAEGIDLTNNILNMNKAVDSPWPGDPDASKGGAIFASTNVTMTAINNIIVRNEARDAGTAVYMESTQDDQPVFVQLWHNVIVGNRGAATSGVVTIGHYKAMSYADLRNNIIAGNSYGIDFDVALDYVKTDKNCIWNDVEGFPGDFSILEDPKLTPGYYPQENSPVIQAGRLLSGHSALLVDKDGLARPQSSLPNIGVFETARNATYYPLICNN